MANPGSTTLLLNFHGRPFALTERARADGSASRFTNAERLWLLDAYSSPLRSFLEHAEAGDALVQQRYEQVRNALSGRHKPNFVIQEPLERYWRIAQMLVELSRDTVIVDIGCGAAWQQIFFQDHRAYYGIEADAGFEPVALQPNATIYQRSFPELVGSGEFLVDKSMVALLGYRQEGCLTNKDERILSTVKQFFDRLVIV